MVKESEERERERKESRRSSNRRSNEIHAVFSTKHLEISIPLVHPGLRSTYWTRTVSFQLKGKRKRGREEKSKAHLKTPNEYFCLLSLSRYFLILLADFTFS